MKWDRFNKFPNPHTTKIILEVTDGWHINTLNKNGFRPLHLAVKVCKGFNPWKDTCGRVHTRFFFLLVNLYVGLGDLHHQF